MSHHCRRSASQVSFSTSIPPLTANFSPSESSPTSGIQNNTPRNSIEKQLWAELYDCVDNADGMKAEQIAERLIVEQRAAAAAAAAGKSTVDGKMFSLVLLAWRNQVTRRAKTARPSDKRRRKDHLRYLDRSSSRSFKTLEQIQALNDQGVLSHPLPHPTIDDCLTCLECLYETSKYAFHLKNRYNDLLAVHSLNRSFEYADSIWQKIHSNDDIANLAPSAAQEDTLGKVYMYYMKILEFAGNASAAEKLFNEVLLNSTQASLENDQRLDLCCCVLGAYKNSPNCNPDTADKAQHFLSRIQNDPSFQCSKVDTKCYNLLLECWKYAAAEKKRSKRQKNYKRYKRELNKLELLAANKMQAVLSDMNTRGVRPDLTSYKLVIGALSIAGEAIRAEKILTQLVKEYLDQFDAGLKPDSEPFESVLWSYALGRNGAGDQAGEKAETLVKNMKQLYECGLLDTEPSLWCYNICLKIWSQSKSPDAFDRALDLYRRMQTRTSGDTSDTTNTGGYNRIGQNNDTSRQVENGRRQARDVVPDSTSMNTLLKAARKRQDIEKVEELLFQFLEDYKKDPSSNPSPDVVSFGTLISGWTTSGREEGPSRADQLLQLMENLYEHGNQACKPDIFCYSGVMEAWAKSKSPEGASKTGELLRRLLGSNDVQPDTACWNLAIEAAGSAGMGQLGEDRFREMVDLYVLDPNIHAVPDDITVTAVFNGWAKTKDGLAADAIVRLLKEVEEMCSQKILPLELNVIHYSSVLDCLAYAKHQHTAELAESILRDMADPNTRHIEWINPNVRPNVVSYNVVIKAWSFLRLPQSFEKVWSLLHEMINLYEASRDRPNSYGRDLCPNANTFGSVLHTLANSDRTDKDVQAMKIVRLMDKYGIVCNGWQNHELSICLSNKHDLNKQEFKAQRNQKRK